MFHILGDEACREKKQSIQTHLPYTHVTDAFILEDIRHLRIFERVLVCVVRA